jgi:hypothetical protein
MKRFPITLIAMLNLPMAAWGEDVGFKNLRGPITCLRSIAYRANCPASWDRHCPQVWIASLKLCRDYRARDRFTHNFALVYWNYVRFFDDYERKHRIVCGEGDRIARLRAEARGKREGADLPNARDSTDSK